MLSGSNKMQQISFSFCILLWSWCRYLQAWFLHLASPWVGSLPSCGHVTGNLMLVGPRVCCAWKVPVTVMGPLGMLSSDPSPVLQRVSMACERCQSRAWAPSGCRGLFVACRKSVAGVRLLGAAILISGVAVVWTLAVGVAMLVTVLACGPLQGRSRSECGLEWSGVERRAVECRVKWKVSQMESVMEHGLGSEARRREQSPLHSLNERKKAEWSAQKLKWKAA